MKKLIILLKQPQEKYGHKKQAMADTHFVTIQLLTAHTAGQ